jgi:hypothetical protein
MGIRGHIHIPTEMTWTGFGSDLLLFYEHWMFICPVNLLNSISYGFNFT